MIKVYQGKKYERVLKASPNYIKFQRKVINQINNLKNEKNNNNPADVNNDIIFISTESTREAKM